MTTRVAIDQPFSRESSTCANLVRNGEYEFALGSTGAILLDDD